MRPFLGERPSRSPIHTRQSDPEWLCSQPKNAWSSAQGWFGKARVILARKLKVHSTLKESENSLQLDFLWPLSDEGRASHCLSPLPEPWALGREPDTSQWQLSHHFLQLFQHSKCRTKILKSGNSQRQCTTTTTTTIMGEWIHFIGCELRTRKVIVSLKTPSKQPEENDLFQWQTRGCCVPS